MVSPRRILQRPALVNRRVGDPFPRRGLAWAGAVVRHFVLQPAIGGDPNLARDLPTRDEPISVLLPAKADDLEMLPVVLEGIRSNVRHSIEKVLLVAQHTDAAVRLAAALGCEFVDEDDLGFARKSDLPYQPQGTDRRGWLLAQLIKLHADALTGSRYTLCCDADTVFVRPRVFLAGRGAQIVEASHRECHQPYFAAYERLTGLPVRNRVSYIAHHMLFDSQVLRALRSHVEGRSGMPFVEAVLASIDPEEPSGFSEYETYTNFLVYQRGRASLCATPFMNREIARRDLPDYLGKCKSAAPRLTKSVSCHSWREES